MLPRLNLRPRRSTESTKPFALSPIATDSRSPEAREEPPIPPTSALSAGPPANETARPKTLSHRILGSTAPFCRHITLPLPLAVVVLVVYVHIGAHQGVWRQLNRRKGGPNSITWAPFWIAVSYFLVYVPWWYVVWANHWRAQRKKKAFLSRRVHLGGEIAALAATFVALGLTALVARSDGLLVVGFSYATTMAAFFGIQILFLAGTLVGVMYECWAETRFPGSGVHHI